jgi:hypothetical protein
MERAFQKTETLRYTAVHLLFEDGKKQIRVLTNAQLKGLKKTKEWKKILSCTKLQEMSFSLKMKIHPNGNEIKSPKKLNGK